MVKKTRIIRQSLGKDTGIIHFNDAELFISENLPKHVSWDQSKLSAIAQFLRANGKNVDEFLDIYYKVSERKYVAWPESIRNRFHPARTLKTRKPVFRLTQRGEGS